MCMKGDFGRLAAPGDLAGHPGPDDAGSPDGPCLEPPHLPRFRCRTFSVRDPAVRTWSHRAARRSRSMPMLRVAGRLALHDAAAARERLGVHVMRRHRRDDRDVPGVFVRAGLVMDRRERCSFQTVRAKRTCERKSIRQHQDRLSPTRTSRPAWRGRCMPCTGRGVRVDHPGHQWAGTGRN